MISVLIWAVGRLSYPEHDVPSRAPLNSLHTCWHPLVRVSEADVVSWMNFVCNSLQCCTMGAAGGEQCSMTSWFSALANSTLLAFFCMFWGQSETGTKMREISVCSVFILQTNQASVQFDSDQDNLFKTHMTKPTLSPSCRLDLLTDC